MYRQFEPGRNDPCLCDSGLKFKKCCAGRYRDEGNLEASTAAMKNGDFATALAATRAHFTQYLIWHRAHTIPFMASHTPEAHLMFETDVSALSELLDRMGECHRQLSTLDSFSTSLNSMGDLVDHPRWKQRVIYEKVLSALGSSWNEDAGRPILATLEPIENVEDSEILELYLHIEGDRLGFSKRMALIDKIVAEGRSPSVRLQYRGVRALQLMLIGDQDGCVAELRSAINEYKERATSGTDEYGTLQLARSCQLLAGLTNDKELFGEAERLLRKLLATEQYTPSGRAMLWRDLGDVLLDQGQVPEATDAYLRSLDYSDTSLGRLKVAKGMAVMGRNDRAREYIGGLDYSTLSKPEKFDYNTVAARTAVAGGNAAERNTIAKRFEELEVTDPYFRDIRNAVVTELRTPEHHGEVRAAGFFARIFRGASRYLLLQPNLFGLGVNVNTILEDAAGHRAISDKKAESQHEA